MRDRKLKRNILALITEKIYNFICKFINVSETKKYFRSVDVMSEKELERKCRCYYQKLIMQVLLILIITVVASGIFAVQTCGRNQEIVLERGSYGEDIEEMELKTNIDNKEHNFTVDVLPVEYDFSDMEEIFEKGFEYIEASYLGENGSEDNIITDLNLITYIDELGLTVRWSSYNHELIDTDGKITDEILETPCHVELVAELSYKDYSKKKNYVLTVSGRHVSYTEQIIWEIKNYINNLQLSYGSEQQIRLPSEINGYKISAAKKENVPVVILLLGIALAVLIVTKSVSDLRRENQLRDKILLQKYPEFVDKLSLYMGAGLSVRGALYKMIESSSKNSEDGKTDRDKYVHILEDEIKYTLNEISSGISEGQAYINLGHRLKLSVYLKLTSLLSQNVRKGTKNVLQMLAEEEECALLLKRELAKKKGEEAGTKLLFPMIILLGVVMVIVMLPALMNF